MSSYQNELIALRSGKNYRNALEITGVQMI